jgi:hypothetical protein
VEKILAENVRILKKQDRSLAEDLEKLIDTKPEAV